MFQKIIIMIRLLEEFPEGSGTVFAGHIEIVNNSGEHNILLHTTKHQSAGAEIFL
jgi:hypothetical protein